MTTEITLTLDLTVTELFTALDALREALYRARAEKANRPHADREIDDIRRTLNKVADRLKVL